MNVGVDRINEFSDSDSRGLDILLEIQQSSTRRNAFTQLAIARLLDSNLAAKYAITGRLGNILLLPHPYPLLCGAMFLNETSPFNSVLCFLPWQLSFRQVIPDVKTKTNKNHLRFGLPRLLFPGTSIAITLLPTYSSFLCNTCPHHFNLLSCTFLDVSPTFLSLRLGDIVFR